MHTCLEHQNRNQPRSPHGGEPSPPTNTPRPCSERQHARRRRTFPGEDPNAGSVSRCRIGEANDQERTLETDRLLAQFQDEIAVSSAHVTNAESIARGHSWGLAGITASEVAGAHYDRVHSIAGAGMPADWEADPETAYFHWSYVDALSMAQSTSLVWDGKIPSTHPAFQSTIYEREGDFDLYLPGPGHGQASSPILPRPFRQRRILWANTI